MPNVGLSRVAFRMLLVFALLAGALALPGCSDSDKTDPEPLDNTATEPVPDGKTERPPGFTSWQVSINDEDSYTEGDVTYTIALNLTATNPSQDIAGTYTGTATAKTDTVGTVEGLPLNASAIVNSSKLEFTLVDMSGSGDDGLAALTAEGSVYSGTGSIVMEAAGSGTIGAAGGGFSNTSGQAVEVSTKGSAVTFSVVISGHKYTFEGTLSGS